MTTRTAFSKTIATLTRAHCPRAARPRSPRRDGIKAAHGKQAVAGEGAPRAAFAAAASSRCRAQASAAPGAFHPRPRLQQGLGLNSPTPAIGNSRSHISKTRKINPCPLPDMHGMRAFSGAGFQPVGFGPSKDETPTAEQIGCGKSSLFCHFRAERGISPRFNSKRRRDSSLRSE